MPADARLWVYQSDRTLSLSEVAAIEQEGRNFVGSWAAHGASLKAAFEVRYNLFIVFAADERQALASGCSIDESVRFIKSLESKYGIRLFDRMNVAFRANDAISVVSLAEFEKLADERKVNGETIVFNNMVSTCVEFGSDWEVPLAKSWQSRVLH